MYKYINVIFVQKPKINEGFIFRLVLTRSHVVWYLRCKAVGSQSTAIKELPKLYGSVLHSMLQPLQNLHIEINKCSY